MKHPDLDIQKIMFPILHFEGIDFKTRFPPNIIDKRCLMVIGNYGMKTRPQRAPGSQTFASFANEKWKPSSSPYI